MKNKFISFTIFFILAYIAPLAGSVSLLFSVQVVVIACIILMQFLTQPPLSISETNLTKNNDRFSVVFIVIAGYLTQLFSILEWRYFRVPYHVFSFDLFTVVGAAMLLGGTIFRTWSINTLGKYFTATVQTQANQKIITNSVYSLIRHPSYLGGYIIVIGSSILLHAYFGVIFSAIVMGAAYYYRIKAEEETLVREFGEEYVKYQTHTRKFLPLIY
jgi:protein-S-isoprenylcysteine O-methyltransferase Ste14